MSKSAQPIVRYNSPTTPDLFTASGILGEELDKDLHNYGTAIKSMSVGVVFQEEESMRKKLENIIKNLMSQQDQHKIEKLQVSGRSDDQFERLLNAGEVTDKIDINVKAREDGLANKREVFDTLISKIP